MKKLVVANWKMLPETLGQAEELIARTEECVRDLAPGVLDLVICPPFVFLEDVARLLSEGSLVSSASLGAQDIAAAESGAFTGEVSGAQLVSMGARYVIIGHSERRWKLGEPDDIVNTKLKIALREGLTPIVCLGERTRESGWEGELAAQTAATFKGLSAAQISALLVAYEPVWAISTTPGARPDTPASAVQSMSAIRELLADRFDVSHTTFLYGGSVTPDNADAFMARDEIAGVLVGGASVRADDFCRILTIAASHS